MASTEDLHIANLFSLKGYVCLVTGGGTGIGLMATQALAANGAKVYITGRRKEVLENAAQKHSPQSRDSSLNGEIIPIGPCDVTKKEDLERLTAELESKEKYLSLVVAAAGVSGPKGRPDTSDANELKAKLWEEDPEAWNSTYNTNVTGVFFSVVSFLPLLQRAPKGQTSSVIVISSMSGMMRDSQAHFSYNAAKAATAHLSRMMSKEFAKTGIRVNSIAPGYFPSEMTMKGSDEDNKAHMPKEKVEEKGHSVPAGRAGSDEEMAMGVIFLSKCGYVNGEVLKLDGGVLNEVGS
ncbi:Short-chain dehydrogenase/reductase PhomF [Exophiala dermatitidis]